MSQTYRVSYADRRAGKVFRESDMERDGTRQPSFGPLQAAKIHVMADVDDPYRLTFGPSNESGRAPRVGTRTEVWLDTGSADERLFATITRTN